MQELEKTIEILDKLSPAGAVQSGKKSGRMTLEEAIKHCEERAKTCDECGKEHAQLAEWLKEVQQYRAIGTVEECREDREKRKPIKVKEIHVDEYFCPSCGAENNCNQGIVEDKFCPECGQAIQWDI